MPQSYDLLVIQPLEVTEAAAKSRADLRTSLGRLTAQKGWSNEGKPRDEILANVDEQFIHHGEHYDKMIKGGTRPDGSTFSGTKGIKSISLEVSEATAEVIVHGSREWEPSAHEYTTRVQFQNFSKISAVKEHTWSEKARMLLDDNMLVDCDCNAFRYFHRRAATRKGFALVSEKRAARIRNPRNKGGVCKHLEHALVYMGASYPKLASAMKSHAGRGKVQESVLVLEEVDTLSEEQGGRLPAHAVVSALNKHGVEHTLIGGHAVGPLTGEPRATKDVDVVVADVEKAHAAIAAEFPHLIRQPNPGEHVTRYHDPAAKGSGERAKEVLNILHPVDVFKVGLSHAQPAYLPSPGGVVHTRVPTLPAMLALKGAAHLSPSRKLKDTARDHADVHALMDAHLKKGGDAYDSDYVLAKIPGNTDHISKYLHSVADQHKQKNEGTVLERVTRYLQRNP